MLKSFVKYFIKLLLKYNNKNVMSNDGKTYSTNSNLFSHHST